VGVLGDGANAASSAGNVDLGGGAGGSLGQNNFKTFTAANAKNNIAASIFVTGTGGATATVSAKNNLFTDANPAGTTRDSANNTAAGGLFPGADGTIAGVNTTLTGANATVAALYLVYLDRAASASDLAFWSGLPSPAAAGGIIRSQEALTNLVESFYVRYLSRAADSGGLSFYVGQMLSGTTEEAVIVEFVTSTEFLNRSAGPGSPAYIAALYSKLLGRAASTAEIDFWNGVIGSLGNAGVANLFVHSGEFRGLQVGALYGNPPNRAVIVPNLLHRTTAPSSAELSFWVNSGLDLLTIQADFGASAEFAANG
jgi:hypothetical protein